MPKIKYSESQKKAIYCQNKNIIVSAQAGAGKTQVLVERIMTKLRGIKADERDGKYGINPRLTADRTDIDNMLIVTFTNKAALEMKDRIKSSIRDLITEEAEDSKYLIDQYNKVTNAQISTMHSFCINSLRDNFHKLDLNPQFKIINQASVNILKWEAMDQTFKDFYEKEDEDFHEFIFEYSGIKDDETAKALLFTIYDFLISQIDPFAWLEEKISQYQDIDVDLSEEERIEKSNRYKEICLEAFYQDLPNLDGVYKLMEEASIAFGLMGKIRNWADSDTIIFNDLKLLSESKNYDRIYNYLSQVTFARKPRISQKDKESGGFDQDSLDSYSNLRDEFKKLIKSLKESLEFDLDDLVNKERTIKKYLVTIDKILRRFDKIFKEKKKEKDGIDFSDAEHLMIRLLADDDVCRDIRDKYAYIFFDEYQDSNQVQNYIVESIKREDNLFFVGDIKQSIYRFRLADPNIFNRRYEYYKNGDDPKNMAVDLTENYRSREEILDFTNFIFSTLMTRDMGEVDYDSPAHRLVCAGTFDPLKDQPAIEINYIRNQKNIGEDEDLSYRDFDMALINESNQPYLIAKKIASMVKKGARPMDFGILIRNKRMIESICSYLQLFNIPYFTDSINIDFTRLEILEFIDILKAIDNDKDDLVLLSALTSVVGNFTEDDLVAIRRDKNKESFHRAFYSYKDRKDLDEELVDKIEQYIRTIDMFNDLEKIMSLEDFLWFVLIESGFMTYILSKNSGKKRVDNIVSFIDQAGDYEQNASGGLYNFLRYVDRLSKRSLDSLEPVSSLSDEDDVVRVMTIHKSKGLQIKNVIIANADKRFNVTDLRGKVVFNNDAGIAMRTYNPLSDSYEGNLFVDQITKIKKAELLSEEVRLQYVALTRAIDRLMIFSDVKENFFDSLTALLNTNTSPVQWISNIVLRDKISDGFKLKNNISIESTSDKLSHMKKSIKINLYENEDLIKEKLSEIKLVEDNDIERSETTYPGFDFFNYEYGFKGQTKLPFKKTVSQLSSFNDNKDPEYKEYTSLLVSQNDGDADLFEEEKLTETLDDLGYQKPSFIDEEKTQTPAEYGILSHYILQVLPVARYDQDSLEEALYKLLEENKISKEELDQCDRESIIYFYNSELGKRILRSEDLRREESFTMRYSTSGNNYLVDGQIDLFFIEDGEIVLIDFKTSATISQTRYKRQFDLYTQGLEEATGMKVKERYVYWTKFRQFTKI